MMKNMKLAFAVVGVVMVLLCVPVLSSMNNGNLQVNQLKGLAEMKLDVDGKTAVVSDIDKDIYTFLDRLPFDGYDGYVQALYGRENFDTDVYDVLLQYEFFYQKPNTDETIKLAFSSLQQPLRCYYINIEQPKVSVIEEVNVVIYQYEGTYLVTFEDNGIYFDIETQNVSMEQLEEILTSIID